MILTIFDDMKSGVFEFDAFVYILVGLVTAAFAAIVIIYMLKHIPILKRLKRELKSARRVAALPDTLNVEGEVVSIREDRYTRWEIQYIATVVYYVGEITYYGDFSFLNRGSLRVGTRLDLLCDKSNPASSAAADGSQITALRKLISIETFRVIFQPVLCFGFYMIFLGYLSGRIEPD